MKSVMKVQRWNIIILTFIQNAILTVILLSRSISWAKYNKQNRALLIE